MTHRHSRLELAIEERPSVSQDRASDGHQDSVLLERISRNELREMVRQQRLHFLLLEHAMEQLSIDLPDASREGSPLDAAQSLPRADARTALQQELEAILLAELCDESDLDSSDEIVSP